jgi:hypothetical protein
MRRGYESDSDSTAHRWSGSNRLILNCEYLLLQVLAVTGLEGLTLCQLESSRSIRFSFRTQENGTFVLFVEEAPRKFVQVRYVEDFHPPFH